MQKNQTMMLIECWADLISAPVIKDWGTHLISNCYITSDCLY